jgi:hypothetical protein
MPDLTTALAIITVITAIVGTGIAYLALRRTPKLPKPPFTLSCMRILGAGISEHIDHLPTYSPNMTCMGLDRRSS